MVVHKLKRKGCRRRLTGYRQAMTRTERLAERAITFAVAEPNQDLAVARLAFLAHYDHPALDAAIEACLARHDRSLRTRWRAISFLVRVRYGEH